MEYIGKFFFEDLIGFIIFGLVFVMVLEGDDVIVIVCCMMGKINLLEVDFGIICVDYVVYIN